MDDLSTIIRGVYPQVRLPLSLAGILGAIYLVELIFAGDLAYGAAYGYITSLPRAYDPVLAVTGPFLHSNHDHIFWNSLHLVILGWIVRMDESELDFLVFFILSALFTASIFPMVVGGGPGFGISGATAALAGWAAVHRGREWYRFSTDGGDSMKSFVSWRYLKIIVLFSLPLGIFFQNIGQGVGYYDAKEGVSVFGHFVGALFGIAFGFQELIRDKFWNT